MGTGGAIMVMWFAEAGWMVFPLERAVWDRRNQERVVVIGRTLAVTCKGLSRSCRKRGLPTGTARAVWASEGWGEAGKLREKPKAGIHLGKLC